MINSFLKKWTRSSFSINSRRTDLWWQLNRRMPFLWILVRSILWRVNFPKQVLTIRFEPDLDKVLPKQEPSPSHQWWSSSISSSFCDVVRLGLQTSTVKRIRLSTIRQLLCPLASWFNKTRLQIVKDHNNVPNQRREDRLSELPRLRRNQLRATWKWSCRVEE